MVVTHALTQAESSQDKLNVEARFAQLSGISPPNAEPS